MKTKLLLLASGIAFLFSSCTMQRRLYRPGFYLDHHSHAIITEICEPSVKINSIENNFAPKKIAQPTNNCVPIALSIDSIPPKTDSSKVVAISSLVGTIIDKDEKIKYHLFPFFKTEDFGFAFFVQEPDGSLFLIGRMKDGTERKIPYTMQQFQNTQADNFGDENAARIQGRTTLSNDDLAKSKRAASAVGAGFLLTILAFLSILSGAIILFFALALAGFLSALVGTFSGINLLKAHKKDESNLIRNNANLAVSSGGLYFILLLLFIFYVAFRFSGFSF